MENYLSEEEQYKQILSQEEIERIKDFELRSIRAKYWSLRHEAFKNEHGIPDSEIGNVYNRLLEKEASEIEDYKKRTNNNL